MIYSQMFLFLIFSNLLIAFVGSTNIQTQDNAHDGLYIWKR